jgi:hypothetical protein
MERNNEDAYREKDTIRLYSEVHISDLCRWLADMLRSLSTNWKQRRKLPCFPNLERSWSQS